MIIDYEQYKKMEPSIDEKNKQLIKAIGNLMMVDYENQLIYTKNTDALASITQSSIFLFNDAILKDITKSYNEIEKAVTVLYNEGYQELICDKPSILGHEVVILSNKINDNEYDLNFFKKEEYDYILKSIPAEYLEKDGNKMFLHVREYYYDRKKLLPEGIEKNLLKNLLKNTSYSYYEKKIISSKEAIADGGEPILISGCISYSRTRNSCSIKAVDAELKSTLKIDYAKSFFSKIAGTDLISFISLAKRVEQFTYGYYKDDINFTTSAKHSRTRYLNNEYGNYVQRGRYILDSFEKSYYQASAILQGAIESNRSYEDTVNFIMQTLAKDKSVITRTFSKALELILSSSKNKRTVEALATDYNKVFSYTIKALSEQYSKAKKDDFQIYYRDDDEVREEKSVLQYLERLALVQENLTIYDKIQKSTTLDTESNIDGTISEESIKDAMLKFMQHTRATLFDNKVDSYVLNFRDLEEDEVKYSDNVKILMDNNEDFRNLVDKLEKNKFHDYFEIDAGFINDNGIQYLNKFADVINNMSIPVKSKTALRFRKLGNYRASGIYFRQANLIGVDFRILRSYIHELTHHIDISANLTKLGRESLVSALYSYFDDRITEKRDYYLSDVELIARAGEVAYLLQLGDYQNLKIKYENKEITKDEFVESLYKNFSSKDESFLMEKLTAYNNSPQYLDIKDLISNDKFYLLDRVNEYYKPFYTQQETDIEKILDPLVSSSKSGFTNRNVHGLQPNSFFRTRGDFTLGDGKVVKLPIQPAPLNFDLQGTRTALDPTHLYSKDISLSSVKQLMQDTSMSNLQIFQLAPFSILEHSDIMNHLNISDSNAVKALVNTIYTPADSSQKKSLKEAFYAIKNYDSIFHVFSRTYQQKSPELSPNFTDEILNTDDFQYALDLVKSEIYYCRQNTDISLVKGIENQPNFNNIQKLQLLLSVKEDDIIRFTYFTKDFSDIEKALKDISLEQSSIMMNDHYSYSNLNDFIKLYNGDNTNATTINTKEMSIRTIKYCSKQQEKPLSPNDKLSIISASQDTSRYSSFVFAPLTLGHNFIEDVNLSNTQYLRDRKIEKILENEIISKDGNSIMSYADKVEYLLEKAQHAENKERVMNIIAKNSLKTVYLFGTVEDFREIQEKLKKYTLQEDDYLSMPKNYKEAIEIKSAPLKSVIEFPSDIWKLNDDNFSRKIFSFSQWTPFVLSIFNHQVQNNNAKRVIEMISYESVIPRNIKYAMVAILAKGTAKQDLILDEKNLEIVCDFASKVGTFVLYDGDVFNYFSLTKSDNKNIFLSLVDFYKTHDDQHIMNALQKIKKPFMYLKHERGQEYNRIKYGGTDKDMLDRMAVTTMATLCFSRLPIYKINTLDSNRKTLATNIVYAIKDTREKSEFHRLKSLENLFYVSKEDAQNDIGKIKAELEKSKIFSGGEVMEKLSDAIEKKVNSTRDNIEVNGINLDKLLFIHNKDSRYEIGKTVSYTVLILNSIKNSFLKNPDMQKHTSNILEIIDKTGDVLYYNTQKISLSRSKEFQEPAIASIQNAIQVTMKIAEALIDKKIPITLTGFRNGREQQSIMNMLKDIEKHEEPQQGEIEQEHSQEKQLNIARPA